MNVRRLTAATAVAFLAVAVGGRVWATGAIATAVLKFADGSDAGTIKLTEAPAGVLLKFDLKGLTPGPHALHVHETGKCEADFSGAGGIYNPETEELFLGSMAGDLPNVVAAADGTAAAEVLTTFFRLSKETEDTLFDADGSALVLFEKADDYLSEPEGAAGTRVACGVLKAE